MPAIAMPDASDSKRRKMVKQTVNRNLVTEEQVGIREIFLATNIAANSVNATFLQKTVALFVDSLSQVHTLIVGRMLHC